MAIQKKKKKNYICSSQCQADGYTLIAILQH